ncbi:MAG: 30S ribosomal protein S17e [Methanoregulaceae archaeon]|nr:30S ribosomal protein S17e [Methanoregulaceae archaeon]
MFARWIDIVIQKISPKTLEIEYEDLDGKRKKAKVKQIVTEVTTIESKRVRNRVAGFVTRKVNTGRR